MGVRQINSPMGRQAINLPADVSFPLALHLGPNDSSIHRGDREDTGDEEARPTETGSGPARSTFDPSSLGGGSTSPQSPDQGFDAGEELRDEDGFEVMEATDGRLGLTNIGDTPSDDWAADTGPTRSPEEAD